MHFEWWSKSAEEDIEHVHSSSSGLSDDEARARLEKDGPNVTAQEKPVSFAKVAFEEITEPTILLLIVVGLGYVFLRDYAESVVVFIVLSIIVLIEIYTEYRAKRTIQALKMLTPSRAVVVRGGTAKDIDAHEIVVGDVLKLSSGERVVADCRIIRSFSLAIDESILTGESAPVSKNVHPVAEDAPVAERSDAAFAGTFVVRGEGTGIVMATGKDTELGKIQKISASVKVEKTALQKRISHLTVYYSAAAIIASAAVFFIGIAQRKPFGEMLTGALSLAFATIPEDLPILIAVLLAVGAYRLSRKGAVIKTLYAAETLGSVDVICSDKTGTFTENKMQMAGMFWLGRAGEGARVSEQKVGVEKMKEEKFKEELFEAGAFASDPSSRDPTDLAFLSASNVHPRDFVVSFPLDDFRKRMSFVYSTEKGNYEVYCKGAAKGIVEICNKYSNENGIHDMTDDDRKAILNEEDALAKEGLRVIAVGKKSISHVPKDEKDAESALIFVGLCGLEDPVRNSAISAVKEASRAGIRTIMITGDHPRTARAVALKLGLENPEKVLTGPELDKMNNEEFKDALRNVSVFARTTPENKLRIVRELKSEGRIVAVTGDGVNDAPALKQADVGVAMGETGSDAAREAAAIVLLDDDFATITTAVRTGRNIFENLKKTATFYISAKVALILIALVPLIAGFQLALAPIMIIFMEVFVDSTASTGYVEEPIEPGTMARPPRKRDAPIFTSKVLSAIATNGLLLFFAVFAMFLYGGTLGYSLAGQRSFAFGTLMVSQAFLCLNLRSLRIPNYRLGWSSNRLILALAAIIIIAAFVVIQTPFLHTFFGTASLTLQNWLLIFVVGFAVTFWWEPYKALSCYLSSMREAS